MSRRSFWQSNGLSLTLGAVFVLCLSGQIAFGHAAFNQERVLQHEAPMSLAAYASSGHFLSALLENWESKFLQMGMYVLLTVSLRQRGSAESRPMTRAQESERIDEGPKPWPLRAGGLWRRLYANSLALALLLLFVVSFAGHAYESWRLELAEQAMQGRAGPSLLDHVTGAQFWFESMQNWQSEFLAVLALVVFSIVLRQDKSPQSKLLEAPHGQTGS